jgi:HPr kinase/phosphorylase
MDRANATIHATAVLTGAKAALIRGPAGSGKSALAWGLVRAGAGGLLPLARLVADDRAYVEARSGRLLVRPAPELAGRIEIRGLGVRRIDFEPIAVVGLVVDLDAKDSGRLPEQEATSTEICGVRLPRLGVAAGMPALPLVLAVQGTAPTGD